MDIIETWRLIPGYGSLYEVSDQGRVRRWWRGTRTRYARLAIPELVKLQRGGGNAAYRVVNLRGPTGQHSRYVHDLVLTAFVGPRPAGAEGSHEDGRPAHNILSNLRWADTRLQYLDKVRHGRHRVGERNARAILTEYEARTVLRFRQYGLTYAHLARWFRVGRGAIIQICNGRNWKHLSRDTAICGI